MPFTPYQPKPKPSGFTPYKPNQNQGSGGALLPEIKGIINVPDYLEKLNLENKSDAEKEALINQAQSERANEIVNKLTQNGKQIDAVPLNDFFESAQGDLPVLQKINDIIKSRKTNQQDAILKDANVKDALDNIQAINEALVILQDIQKVKKNTPTGPGYSRLFDSGIRKFDDKGQESPPGPIDTAVTTLFPNQAQKLRELNQSTSRLFDFIATKAGKAITGTEKGSVLAQFPGIYEKESTFNSVLNKSYQNLQELKREKVEFLRKVGVDQNTIGQFEKDPVGLEQPQQSGDLSKVPTEELLKQLGL